MTALRYLISNFESLQNTIAMKTNNSLFTLFFAMILFVSCKEDEPSPITDLTLNVNFSGLEDLGSDFVYEGWVLVNGSPVSTGTFRVDSEGKATPSSFLVSKADLEEASMFVLSIEPANDSDPGPAATKILAGEFSNNSASLSSGLIGDFSNAAGSFFLRTPTDETSGNNGNDQNGVWFGLPGAPPLPDFVLPELPEGWAYEGWVVGDNGPLTTGTFTEFNMMDEAAPFSGPNPGPPVPGEDFFLNAPSGETFPLDIRGRTVVISVEPVPDNSPGPFSIKPLVGTAGQETAPTTYSLGKNLGSLPTGTVSF